MDTMSEKSLRAVIVVFGLLLIWSAVLLANKSEQYKRQEIIVKDLQKQVDSLQVRSDSLYDELFPIQVELGRYEVAYEIFMERNPKAAHQYGTIISEETE